MRINLTSRANDLPPLDFNPDPNVAARARVALILHTARLNGMAHARERRQDEKEAESLGIRWLG